jgi:uncharacterized protein YjbJ (UPF0337 family)
MDWDRVGGSWKRIKGRLRERLGELTADESNIEAGRREQQVGELQEREQIPAEEAERRVDETAEGR